MENQSVGTRRGGPEDHAFIDDLGKRVVMDSVASFRDPIPALVDVSFERLLSYVTAQSHAILIGEADGKPAGFLLLLDTLPDEVTLLPQAFVAYMAVEPWARRRGLGRALLAEAERYARSKNLPTVSMMVTEENAAARSLYDRSGFITERRLLTKIL